MLRTLSADIAHSWISAQIQNHVWVVPAVQSIHILAIAALIFAAFSADYAILRRPSAAGAIPWLAGSYRWTWTALLVLLVSGSILITGEPKRSLMNLYFWIKMGSVIVAGILTLILQRSLVGRGQTALPRAALVALAVFSVLLWVLILFCGRFIAYFGDFSN
jgi:uncharacterized membrane protein